MSETLLPVSDSVDTDFIAVGGAGTLASRVDDDPSAPDSEFLQSTKEANEFSTVGFYMQNSSEIVTHATLLIQGNTDGDSGSCFLAAELIDDADLTTIFELSSSPRSLPDGVTQAYDLTLVATARVITSGNLRLIFRQGTSGIPQLTVNAVRLVINNGPMPWTPGDASGTPEEEWTATGSGSPADLTEAVAACEDNKFATWTSPAGVPGEEGVLIVDLSTPEAAPPTITITSRAFLETGSPAAAITEIEVKDDLGDRAYYWKGGVALTETPTNHEILLHKTKDSPVIGEYWQAFVKVRAATASETVLHVDCVEADIDGGGDPGTVGPGGQVSRNAAIMVFGF